MVGDRGEVSLSGSPKSDRCIRRKQSLLTNNLISISGDFQPFTQLAPYTHSLVSSKRGIHALHFIPSYIPVLHC